MLQSDEKPTQAPGQEIRLRRNRYGRICALRGAQHIARDSSERSPGVAGSLFPVGRVLAATARGLWSNMFVDVRGANQAAAAANTPLLRAWSPGWRIQRNSFSRTRPGRMCTISAHDRSRRNHIDLMSSTCILEAWRRSRHAAGFLHAIAISRSRTVRSSSTTAPAGFNTAMPCRSVAGQRLCVFPNLYDSQLAPPWAGSPCEMSISRRTQWRRGPRHSDARGLDASCSKMSRSTDRTAAQRRVLRMGLATNEPKNYQRQTSHAHNVQVKN